MEKKNQRFVCAIGRILKMDIQCHINLLLLSRIINTIFSLITYLYIHLRFIIKKKILFFSLLSILTSVIVELEGVDDDDSSLML